MFKLNHLAGFWYRKQRVIAPPSPPLLVGAYLSLPGDGSGSIAYTGNMALPSVTDSFSIAIKLVPTAGWNGSYGSLSTIISKWNTGNGTFIFFLSGGGINFRSSTNGTIVNNKTSSSLIYATNPPSGSTPYWLGVTCTHAGSGDVSFYTSTDGTTWSQLGSSSTLTYTGSIYNPSTTPLRIGSYISATGGNTFDGKIYRIKIFNGVNANFNSSPIVDFNPELYVSGSTVPSNTGETWTLSGTAQILV